MSTRSDSGSTVLLAVILIITFPLWFGLGAGLIGVVVGLMGAAVGIAAAIFGVLVALICLPFKILFGWNDWSWHIFPHHNHHGFVLVVLVILAAVIIRGRRTA